MPASACKKTPAETQRTRCLAESLGIGRAWSARNSLGGAPILLTNRSVLGAQNGFTQPRSVVALDQRIETTFSPLVP